MANFTIETLTPTWQKPGTTRQLSVMKVTSSAALAKVAAAQRRILIMVTDLSGSMDGEKILALRNAVAETSNILEDGLEVIIFGFDDNIHPIFDNNGKPVVVNAQVRAQIRALAEQPHDRNRFRAMNDTHMANAMKKAARIVDENPGALVQIWFMTDGENHDGNADINRDSLYSICSALGKKGVSAVPVLLGGAGSFDYMQSRMGTPMNGRVRVATNAGALAAELKTNIGEVQSKAQGGVYVHITPKALFRVVEADAYFPDKKPLQLAEKLADGTLVYLTEPWGPNEERKYSVILEIAPPADKAAVLLPRLTADGNNLEMATWALVYEENGKTVCLDGSPITIGFSGKTELTEAVTPATLAAAEATGTLDIVQAKQAAMQKLVEYNKGQGSYEDATQAVNALMDVLEQKAPEQVAEMTQALGRINVQVPKEKEEDGTRAIQIRKTDVAEVQKAQSEATVTRSFKPKGA